MGCLLLLECQGLPLHCEYQSHRMVGLWERCREERCGLVNQGQRGCRVRLPCALIFRVPFPIVRGGTGIGLVTFSLDSSKCNLNGGSWNSVPGGDVIVMSMFTFSWFGLCKYILKFFKYGHQYIADLVSLLFNSRTIFDIWWKRKARMSS